MHRTVFTSAILVAVLSAPAWGAPVTPVRLFERSLGPTGSLDANYLAGGADVDGDGRPDILLGTENQTFGRISIFSGGNAGLIATIDGRTGSTFLGSAVAFIGDIDGDGVSDFVASADGDASAFVYSGATRARLLPRAGLIYGGAIVPLGDIDADSVPDFLVGRVLDGPAAFIAAAYSGRTGGRLYTVTDSSQYNAQTTAGSAVGDLDGDGITEALVGGFGMTWLLSGKSGAILRFWGFSGWTHGVGDVTGDGLPDYAIANHLYSGATGESFFPLPGPAIGLGQVDGAGGLDMVFLTSAGIVLYDYQAEAVIARLDDPDLRLLAARVMEPMGDLDGDGTTDFAIAGSRGSRAELHVYRNLRGTGHAAALDVLPKACPNVLSANGGGPVEVAILGDGTGDLSKIDAASIRLAGVAPSSTSVRLRDVGTSGVYDNCACPGSAADGIADLVLRFDAAALRGALEPVTAGIVASLPLSGRGTDGSAWFGADCVTISSKGNHAATATLSGSTLRTVGSNVVAAGAGVDLAYAAPADDGAVHVTVFDLAGRRVAELPDGASVDGVRTTRWDGRDAQGAPARRGVYFVQARGAGASGKSVMVVVR